MSKVVLFIGEKIKQTQLFNYIISCDYNYVITYNFREAIGLFTQVTPDIVIINYDRKLFFHLDDLQELKYQINNVYIPIVLIVNSNDRKIRIEALKHGINGFINLPFDKEETAYTLHNCFSISDKRNEFFSELKLL